jgi:hypothetical protein
MTNPMTTVNDLVVGGASGTPSRLAAGANGKTLRSVSGAPTWSDADAALTNPMTTAGDIIIGGVSGAPTRLAKGADGKYLTMVAGVEAWGDAQPLDSDLTAIAALTTTSFGRSLLILADAAALLAAAGAQASDADLTSIAALTTTSFGRSLLTLADAAALLAAAGGQASDADLTAIAALTTTTYGRSLLTLADAAAGLTSLGAQPVDSDLTAIAAIAPTNDDVIQRKAGAWINRSVTQLLADLAAIGTTFQPLDSDLTSIAALTTTSFGRSFLTQADAAAARAYIAPSAPADANYFLQRNSGNTADEYLRRYFAINVVVTSADGTGRIIELPASQGVIITGGKAWKATGSCTLALKINTTAITSLSALSITTTEGSVVTATGANDAVGADKINYTVSADSGGGNLNIHLQGYIKRATA